MKYHTAPSVRHAASFTLASVAWACLLWAKDGGSANERVQVQVRVQVKVDAQWHTTPTIAAGRRPVEERIVGSGKEMAQGRVQFESRLARAPIPAPVSDSVSIWRLGASVNCVPQPASLEYWPCHLAAGRGWEARWAAWAYTHQAAPPR